MSPTADQPVFPFDIRDLRVLVRASRNRRVLPLDRPVELWRRTGRYQTTEAEQQVLRH
jgi:hypothetical protein